MMRPLLFATIIAVAASAVSGCATRQARVDDDYAGSALARDVSEPERQFPFGPAPFIARPDLDQR